MKLFKKNQVIIYIIALMLMTAGYLNYTTNQQGDSVETSMKMEADDTQVADIGDAKLVNSNDVITNETQNTLEENNKNSTIDNNTTNTIKNETANTSSNSTNTGNNTVETSSNSKDNNDYFTTSRLERDTMYSQILETYEKILNSSNSLETQKQSATEEIKKINDIKNSIMICENLIKTKGFENVVIFVNGDSVSIIVRDDQLNTEKVAQIQNIISREMNTKVENIHISNK